MILSILLLKVNIIFFIKIIIILIVFKFGYLIILSYFVLNELLLGIYK